MNRRNFISGILQAGTLLVLPSAKTYERIWKQIAHTEMPPTKIYITVWSGDGEVFNQFTVNRMPHTCASIIRNYGGTICYPANNAVAPFDGVVRVSTKPPQDHEQTKSSVP